MERKIHFNLCENKFECKYKGGFNWISILNVFCETDIETEAGMSDGYMLESHFFCKNWMTL